MACSYQYNRGQGDATSPASRESRQGGDFVSSQSAPQVFRLEVFDSQTGGTELERHLRRALAEQGVTVNLMPLFDEQAFGPGRVPVLRGSVAPSRRELERASDRRGASQLSQWIEDGTLVAGDELAEAWNTTVESLWAGKLRGGPFALAWNEQYWFCCELLKFTREEFELVNAALGDATPEDKIAFLLRSNEELDMHLVGDAVVLGQLDQVLALARQRKSAGTS